MASLDTFVNRMIYWCRDVSLGYSQNDRWDFRDGGNCDCSSLVIHCLNEAGFDTGHATYTGNMTSNLTSRGWIITPNNGQPQYGDILLNVTRHTCVYIGNGQIAQASISEKGTANGIGGDQTGNETNIRGYYNCPWDYYLHYTGDNEMVTDAEMNQIAAKVWGYTYGGGENMFNYQTGQYNTIQYLRGEVKNLQTILTAQNAALTALVKQQGGDPQQINATVQKAVADALKDMKITLTTQQ